MGEISGVISPYLELVFGAHLVRVESWIIFVDVTVSTMVYINYYINHP